MLNEVHPAQVAGLFYPAGAQNLRELIGQMGKGARGDGGIAPKAVVAPHAGIVYSGSVAATAFGPWARRAYPPRRVVIVGPAHRVAFRGLAIHPATTWSTPLGEAQVSRNLHARLAEARAAAVDVRPFAGEHSLEMHLVMLQSMLPAPFEILPILVGDAEPRRVAEALRLVWGGPETAIALSSDLSHFLDRASAEEIDSDTARRIETLDADSLEGRRACGYLPIMGALAIAAERDLRVSGLHLATSADVGADSSRVVGYGAFALEYATSARLNEADRALLLSTCMAGLAAAARDHGRVPALDFDGRPSPALSSQRTTFVTLTQGGKLRGCIGSPAPSRSLIEDAMTNAVQAGFADPRFAPLSDAELEGLDISVSILSHPRPVPATREAELIEALEPDRDGLILGVGRQRALFLPSVWRQVADPREFVRHLKLKAGLDLHGWPRGLAAAHFRVESFGAPWRATSPAEIAPARIDEAQQLH
ncbi:MAG TPA: AmmeMemoRadiSam system protein B [Roseiarcus sp.]|nr:AmmeMemoRadiSam system protein B [Roseiarcus sp.]